MKITNIVCKLEAEDSFSIEEDFIEYNINDNKSFTYTFWRKQLESLPSFFTETSLDLLYISLFVYGADRIILRDLADDCWSRNIKLYLPVIAFDKWYKNKGVLENILNFLSGDTWELEFRERGLTKIEKKFKEKMEEKNLRDLKVDKICMFSGGLDSFIGSLDILAEESKENETLFVSHYGGGKGVKEFQDLLKAKLIEKYSIKESNFLSFYASAKNGIEDTTRTRSFMFFAHAISIASTFDSDITLIIPENGLISLNIPLTNSRLGSSSTRTTHPHYLDLLQSLLKAINIKVVIKNPYQFKTKGEMVKECKEISFLEENIVNTMSCSHPDQGRMNGETEPLHCGNCLPCIIRRAAIKASNLVDKTRYRDENGPTATSNYLSYLIGLRKFERKFSFLTIQTSGPITKNIKEFSELYLRGMEELNSFLEGHSEKFLP
ncbi:Qat anti-phage system QueC-like protein QatC [Metabacillus halosaccharovorans]|uniref:Qat anti-phage system QueC-like protein QatC n=1 Tax=Metabacillus halosaccharovorans TaxID=930124 RepID=UPI001C1F2589|nr:ATPase [Metabacillus halosaccharovorans]